MATFNIHFFKELKEAFEQAKQMENAEIIKRTLDGAEDTADYVDKVIVKALVEASKSMVIPEISDDEIEKQSKYWNETTNPDMWTFK